MFRTQYNVWQTEVRVNFKVTYTKWPKQKLKQQDATTILCYRYGTKIIESIGLN